MIIFLRAVGQTGTPYSLVEFLSRNNSYDKKVDTLDKLSAATHSRQQTVLDLSIHIMKYTIKSSSQLNEV